MLEPRTSSSCRNGYVYLPDFHAGGDSITSAGPLSVRDNPKTFLVRPHSQHIAYELQSRIYCQHY